MSDTLDRIYEEHFSVPPVPDDDTVISGVPDDEFTPAKFIATGLGLRGNRRLGVKSSVGGNWSGRMSPALRLSAILLRLHREGRLHATHDGDRWLYRRPKPGEVVRLHSQALRKPPQPKPEPVQRPRNTLRRQRP